LISGFSMWFAFVICGRGLTRRSIPCQLGASVETGKVPLFKRSGDRDRSPGFVVCRSFFFSLSFQVVDIAGLPRVRVERRFCGSFARTRLLDSTGRTHPGE